MTTRIVFISTLLFLLAACGSAGNSNDTPGNGTGGDPGTSGEFYFAASDGVNGTELWKTNGSTEGTLLIKDISTAGDSSPSGFVRFKDMYFFSADDGVNGRELWKTDGTADGTVLVKDINIGGSSNPQYLTVLADTLYFSADDGADGVELWKTDGTPDGTVLVKNINTSTVLNGSSEPSELTVFNNKLYFRAVGDETGYELWKSDGTPDGTVLVKDIYTGPEGGGSSWPSGFTTFNNALYFQANNGPRANGAELWKTDGTSEGTVMVKDIEYFGPGYSSPEGFTVFQNELYFQATQNSTSTNGQAPIGTELWKTDGTENGTVLVKNINPNLRENSDPAGFTVFKGALYFRANDGTSGMELWKTDGTADGTVRVKDINVGGDSNPTSLIVFNDTLYFQADDGVNGIELWKSDGTETGTTLVRDINNGGSSNPSEFSVINGVFYFEADDGVNGRELWKTDGTSDGTVLLEDTCPGQCSGL